MASDDLITKRDAVCDEESFVAFVSALMTDRADAVAKERAERSSPCGSDASDWANTTIEAFLEAACAWADASKNGLQFYEKPQNPWKRCADILYCGKIYE